MLANVTAIFCESFGGDGGVGPLRLVRLLEGYSFMFFFLFLTEQIVKMYVDEQYEHKRIGRESERRAK